MLRPRFVATASPQIMHNPPANALARPRRQPEPFAMPDTIVAEIRKNTREVIRVPLSEFQDRPIVSVRVWFEGEDGGMRPGKNGINFKVELLSQVADAMHEAAEQAAATT